MYSRVQKLAEAEKAIIAVKEAHGEIAVAKVQLFVSFRTWMERGCASEQRELPEAVVLLLVESVNLRVK